MKYCLSVALILFALAIVSTDPKSHKQKLSNAIHQLSAKESQLDDLNKRLDRTQLPQVKALLFSRAQTVSKEIALLKSTIESLNTEDKFE